MESKTARVLRKGRALFGYFACLERPRVHCNKQPFIAKVFFFVFVLEAPAKVYPRPATGNAELDS